MNLQYERIEKFCQQLKLDRLSTEWPAVAQGTVDKNGTHADFLESVLYTEVVYLILTGIGGIWRELMGFLEVRGDFGI
ncbi:hypothetical protein [Arsenophonus sp. PmNCSU2021_1]|uniref:hypothetical protein n=1 Tax=Arsenophonus sp. PmNCSU2021_1 TaxID=3118989 RepID=UPI002FF2BD4B